MEAALSHPAAAPLEAIRNLIAQCEQEGWAGDDEENPCRAEKLALAQAALACFEMVMADAEDGEVA